LKSPSLSFAIESIIDLFPDIKVIAIYREPLACINSWRGIGTGKENDLKRIAILCRKWNETIEYVEEKREKYEFLAIRYEDLVTHGKETISKVFKYCELPLESWIPNIKLLIKDKRFWYRSLYNNNIKQLILKKTQQGRKLLNEIETFNPLGRK